MNMAGYQRRYRKLMKDVHGWLYGEELVEECDDDQPEQDVIAVMGYGELLADTCSRLIDPRLITSRSNTRWVSLSPVNYSLVTLIADN